VAFSMWHFAGLNGDITYGYAARSRNSASRCCFCTTASYDGIPSDKTNQASALINIARNIGGSMGVALSQTIFMHQLGAGPIEPRREPSPLHPVGVRSIRRRPAREG
jgi:hypothetical protein